MHLSSFFQQQKPLIISSLNEIVKQKKQSQTMDVGLMADSYERILSFAREGKMIRGSLFLLSRSFFNKEISQLDYHIAAALELFHSSLLIHDDIMDKDRLRRGKETIFVQYEKEGEIKKVRTPQEFGNNMAMCLGDICTWIAFEILSRCSLSHDVLCYFFQEAQMVGFGQMQDHQLSQQSGEPTEDDILRVYRYKTARYTFSLPLTIGAMMSTDDQQTIQKLGVFGEHTGLIFQLRDDELRIDGIEKTAGSDIRENTKTLLRLFLFQSATHEERKKLETLFGNPDITTKDIVTVQTYMKNHHIDEKIKSMLIRHQQKAHTYIDELTLKDENKALLRELLHYIYSRTN